MRSLKLALGGAVSTLTGLLVIFPIIFGHLQSIQLNIEADIREVRLLETQAWLDSFLNFVFNN